MARFGDIPANTVLTRRLILNIFNFRQGATAPADVEIGTSPVSPGFRFSATGELISICQTMPAVWDRGDITIGLVWSLVNGQTDGDLLSVTMDYIAPRVQVPGQGLFKASTQLTDDLAVTTAEGLAAGELYVQTFALLAADATNPLANADAIVFEIHLTNTDEVADIDLVGAIIDFAPTQ